MKYLFLMLMFLSFQGMSQNRAYKSFTELKFDKAMLYQFNGETDFDFMAHGMLCDTSLVDAESNWAHSLSKDNRPVSEKDIYDLFNIIKNTGKDKMTGDPQGCYIPRVGIAFFKNSRVVAHIDVCLECNKFMIEVFDKELKGTNRSLYGEPSTMGIKTRSFFERLFAKYKVKGG